MARTRHIPRSPQRRRPAAYREAPHHALPTSSVVAFMDLWKHGMKVNDIASSIGISRAIAFRWQQNLMRYGSIRKPFARVKGRPYITSIDDEKAFLEALSLNGWMIQDEMVEWFKEERGVSMDQSSVSRLLQRNGWSRKSIELRSMHRCEPLWRAYVEAMADYPADDLIFIDESIFNEKTGWRRTAYAPISDIARYQGNIERGASWSVLPAMSINGYLPCTRIERGYLNRQDFLYWLEEQLFPAILAIYGPCSKVIVMDNCSIHTNRDVEELINAHGHLVKYLPPYSPDYNPIMLSFSVLKSWVRRYYWKER